ncbi:hypothetical protein TNCV_2237751 [Trichonephila clavipes]|nr:hypothetical protein TNCV_2237751 [Trichonephila clavipes]
MRLVCHFISCTSSTTLFYPPDLQADLIEEFKFCKPSQHHYSSLRISGFISISKKLYTKKLFEHCFDAIEVTSDDRKMHVKGVTLLLGRIIVRRVLSRGIRDNACEICSQTRLCLYERSWMG